eukprot:3204292-Lingulodinium_polyedra.AAC.1
MGPAPGPAGAGPMARRCADSPSSEQRHASRALPGAGPSLAEEDRFGPIPFRPQPFRPRPFRPR